MKFSVKASHTASKPALTCPSTATCDVVAMDITTSRCATQQPAVLSDAQSLPEASDGQARGSVKATSESSSQRADNAAHRAGFRTGSGKVHAALTAVQRSTRAADLLDPIPEATSQKRPQGDTVRVADTRSDLIDALIPRLQQVDQRVPRADFESRTTAAFPAPRAGSAQASACWMQPLSPLHRGRTRARAECEPI